MAEGSLLGPAPRGPEREVSLHHGGRGGCGTEPSSREHWPRGPPSWVCADLACPAVVSGRGSLGLGSARVSSGTGRGAGWGTRGGRRYEVGRARWPVPTDCHWRRWTGEPQPGGLPCLSPQRRHSSQAFSEACSMLIQVWGSGAASAPGGLLIILSAAVTGSWASGKAGRPLADP